MPFSEREQESSFKGEALDRAPTKLPPGVFRLDKGGDRTRPGSWRRRRGIVRTNLAKVDDAIRTLIGFEMPGGDYALVRGEGNSLWGDVNAGDMAPFSLDSIPGTLIAVDMQDRNSLTLAVLETELHAAINLASGADPTVFNADPASRPLYLPTGLNGFPCADFTWGPVQAKEFSGTPAVPYAAPFTFAAVVQCPASGTGPTGPAFPFFFEGSVESCGQKIDLSAVSQSADDGAVSAEAVASRTLPTVPFLIYGTEVETSRTCAVNFDTAVSQATILALGTFSQLNLGQGPLLVDPRPLLVGEWRVWDHVLTTLERQIAISSLMTKWGLVA